TISSCRRPWAGPAVAVGSRAETVRPQATARTLRRDRCPGPAHLLTASRLAPSRPGWFAPLPSLPCATLLGTLVRGVGTLPPCCVSPSSPLLVTYRTP